jgi:hypothetical protein
VIAGVIFDLDSAVVDSEGVWDTARRQLVEQHGGRWRPDAQRTTMEISSPEWVCVYARPTRRGDAGAGDLGGGGRPVERLVPRRVWAAAFSVGSSSRC